MPSDIVAFRFIAGITNCHLLVFCDIFDAFSLVVLLVFIVLFLLVLFTLFAVLLDFKIIVFDVILFEITLFDIKFFDFKLFKLFSELFVISNEGSSVLSIILWINKMLIYIPK